MQWAYISRQIIPGESWYDDLREMGKRGWEAWHIEKTTDGHREIYYKRPSGEVSERETD